MHSPSLDAVRARVAKMQEAAAAFGASPTTDAMVNRYMIACEATAKDIPYLLSLIDRMGEALEHLTAWKEGSGRDVCPQCGTVIHQDGADWHEPDCEVPAARGLLHSLQAEGRKA